MTNNKYAKAYKEVLEIIKYFPEEEYNKIPKEKIEFYNKNMDQEYEFAINPSIDLGKQNISNEANAIIVKLFQDYYATESQKVKIKEILELNEKKKEQKIREKYSPDDLFNNKNIYENVQKCKSQENALIKYKEKFCTKFKNFIMKL